MNPIRYADAEDPHRYDDMLHLPHHVSSTHPQMSPEGRAAQFSPFAALTGYDAEVAEAGRATERKAELSEHEKAVLDERLRIMKTWIDRIPGKWDRPPETGPSAPAAFEPPEVLIRHFVPDEKKAGGAYASTRGVVTRIDLYHRMLVLSGGTHIPLQNIRSIECERFEEF